MDTGHTLVIVPEGLIEPSPHGQIGKLRVCVASLDMPSQIGILPTTRGSISHNIQRALCRLSRCSARSEKNYDDGMLRHTMQDA